MVKNEQLNTQVLEYKNHESWFRDLNTNLQSCRKMGELMLTDIMSINHFYNKIKILKSSYSSYFEEDKAKIINSSLLEVENSIRTPAFMKSIKIYSALKAEKKEEFNGIIWKNIDKLLNIFELINSELKREELTPKPKQKIRSDPNNAVFGGYS